MMLENGNMKQLPPSPSHNTALEEQMSEWTQARVTLWLDANGWSQVSPIFEEKGIYGKKFFSLTLAELHGLNNSGLQLSYADKRKLLYNIKAILPSDNTHISTENLGSHGQYGTRPSPTSSRQPYNEYDTLRSNSSPEFSTFNETYSYAGTQSYRPRPRPATNKLTTTFPPTINTNHTSPRTYGSRQFNRSESANTDYNRIKDIIPERTSSTPEHIYHILENLNYKLPQRRVPDTMERTAARNLQHLLGANSSTGQENGSYRQPPRRPVTQFQDKTSQQRIQVTADADTWFSLTVSDLHDPSSIKDAILTRLNISPHNGPYEFIHENGPYPDSALSDTDLLRLCRMADRSASNRILVRAPAHHNTSDIMASPVGGHFAIGTTDLWAISPSSPVAQGSMNDNRANTLKPTTTAAPSLWAIQPKKSASTSLWATPPSSEPSPNATRVGSEESLWPVEGQTTPSKPVSYWATPPSSSYQSKRASEELLSTSGGGNGNELNSSGLDHPNTLEATVESLSLKSPRKEKNLQIQIPSSSSHSGDLETAKSDYSSRQSPQFGSSTPTQHPRHSSSSESSIYFDASKQETSQIQTKATGKHEHEFWGERPPAEVITQNPDKYFDEQNLDREIIEDIPYAPANSRQGGANLVSRKSVRIKIQETAKSRWPTVQNVIRANNIIRRKSTKMWGQKVVQVKPGMGIEQAAPAPTYVKDEKTEVSSRPGPTKIRWMMGKLIGKGSYGRVYHAMNLDTDPFEYIAVKQVEIPSTKSDLLNEQQRAAIEVLYHEISLLEGLDHENIVQYLGYDSDEAEGHLNIFLEYVAGGSVSSCLTKFGPFKEPLVSHITRQILQGLKYLHAKHILHRDIKGGNILVESDGTCKISDFGLSKLNDQDEVYDQNSKMSLQGSIFWMAPEVVKNEPYSAKVDIWSLGCTVIEMLTGKRPWLDLTALAAVYSLGTCKSPPIPDNISDYAKDFLRQCFIIDPAIRPTATILLQHPFCRVDPTFDFQNFVSPKST